MGFLSSFRKRSADDPPPTESWPLFAFGKLPVYKDFISAGITDDVSRELRDWLSDGFSRHWSNRDDCRAAEIPLHAFLLRLPASRRTAAGAFWGSSDQGGLRRFPFALFTILAGGKAASVLTALDYLPVFEARARELKKKYEAGGSLAEVYQELRGARIEVPVRPEEEVRTRLLGTLAAARVGALANALFGEEAGGWWPALLSGVDAAARRPSAGAAAFRLPLAGEIPPLDQLKLWTVRLARTSGAAPAGVLYRTAGPAPAGVVFFRDARPEDLLLAHPEAIPTDFVEDIPARLGRPTAKAVAAPPPAEGVLRLGAAAAVAPAVPAPAPAAPLEPPPAAAPEPPPPAASEPPQSAVPEPPPPAGLEPAPPAAPEPAPPAAPEPPQPAAPEPPPPAEPVSSPEVPAGPEVAAAAAPPSEPAPPEPPSPLPPVEPAPAPLPEFPPTAPAEATPPPEEPPPEPLPPPEPAGWDLPLASLLGPG